MRIKSTTSGKNLLQGLSSLVDHEFQDRCFLYLSHIYPQLINAIRRKKVDRFGLDLYELSAGPELDFSIAYQCKGFETRFEQSQFDQCMKSLNTVKKSGKRIGHFYLVINLKAHYFDQELKKQLVAELVRLTEECRVGRAALLDAENFTEYLSGLMLEKLKQKIETANRRFAEDYQETMQQRFYYADIPFDCEEKFIQNPTAFVLDGISEQQRSAHPDRKQWFFIISEFGFGKTSLLFSLFRSISKPYSCIYVPIALFSKNDIRYRTFFFQRMLEIVEGQAIDFNDPFQKLYAKLLSYLLQYTDNKTVLLLDGLDEHEDLYHLEMLKNLLNNLDDVKAKVVFSVRKEMWDERQGNFSMVLGKRANHTLIFLNEWANWNILTYLEAHQVSSGLTLSPELTEFRQLVRENRYEAYYGDIPKRPLFLEMIVKDIGEHGLVKRNMSELYIQFFESKFSIDRQGSFSSFSSRRPLQTDEDAYSTLGLLFTALSRIARRMATGLDVKTMIVKTYIEEYEVTDVLQTLGMGRTSELVLNSVLVPSGVRTKQGLSLRFAHKSFQEFFLARAIYNHIVHQLDQGEMITDLDIIHTEGVGKFLLGFIDADFSEEAVDELMAALMDSYPAYTPLSLTDLLIHWDRR